MEIVLTILDKLQKNSPLAAEDLPSTSYRQAQGWHERYQQAAVTAYRASVQRDLEWLLNTRRIAVVRSFGSHDPSHKELEKSVYFYGLASFSYVSLSPEAQVPDTNRLAKEIRETILQFEPRILNPKVTVEQMPSPHREIRFRVTGDLKMKPDPQFVQYHTLLDLDSGHYKVEVPGEGRG